MKTVFITGVSGYIGSKTARELLRQGVAEKVVGIDIRPPAAPIDGLTFVARDVREPMADLLTAHGVDTVIHAAYVLPPIHDKRLMEDINLSGARNVMAACTAAGVSHLLYLSSATAYGFHPDNPVPLVEESPLRGNDDFTYSKNKKELEFLLRDFIRDHPEIHVTVLRPCFVVGPGFDNPLARHLRKRVVLLPWKTAPFQFVHENDLVRLMVAAVNTPLPGSAYNVAGDGTMTFAEMVALLGNRSLRLPAGLARALTDLAWHLRLTFLSEFPGPAVNMLCHTWLVSSEKLKAETGFRFEYDTRAAFADFARAVKGGKSPGKALSATG